MIRITVYVYPITPEKSHFTEKTHDHVDRNTGLYMGFNPPKWGIVPTKKGNGCNENWDADKIVISVET